MMKPADRVGSRPALPAAYHRGRVWEPSQGSHVRWRGAAPAIALVALTTSSCSGSDDSHLRIITGSLPLYRTQGRAPRQDASDAIYLPSLGGVLLVDDGGDPPDPVPFYLLEPNKNFKVSALEDPAMLDLAKMHGDLEAATFDGTYVYVASSLPPENEMGFEDPRFRRFSRFRLEGGTITDVATIDPRPAILEALRPLDAAWFDRVAGLPSKQGGTNVEGLSATPTPGELFVGLRSPHFGPEFPGSTDDPRSRTGLAIIVRIHAGDTFTVEGLQAEAMTLDLGGLGIRSLQYSQTAHGYFLTAGIVEPGKDYAFFFWKGPGAAPVPIELDAFKELCRPESVTEVEYEGRKYLMVLSEESGNLCADPPPRESYFLVELNQAFLDRLR